MRDQAGRDDSWFEASARGQKPQGVTLGEKSAERK